MWAFTRLRALSGSKHERENAIFCNFHHSIGRGRGFCARKRARQWILTKEILLDYLIASVAQTFADLAQIQLKAKPF